MDVWMAARKDCWRDGWRDEWMAQWLVGLLDEWKDTHMNRPMTLWMDS